MKLKKRYDCFGKKIQVKYMDLSQSTISGFYDNEKKTATLCSKEKEVDEQESTKTFLHEMIHAIWDCSGMTAMHTSLDAQEMACENISQWIVDNFKLTHRD